MRLYHGSSCIVERPDLSMSREDIDFGAGFYLAEDEKTAKKWACDKSSSVLNAYEVQLDGLRIKHLNVGKEWLDYVTLNRTANQEEAAKVFGEAEYDVIIGPMVDDTAFTVVDMYIDGLLQAEDAIRIIEQMECSSQVVIKKQGVADKCISFIASNEIKGDEKKQYKDAFRSEAKEASKKARRLLGEIVEE